MTSEESAEPIELTQDVSLTDPSGVLNDAAVGWARRPLVDPAGLTSGPRRSWGRTKRWEYWNVITDTHIVSLIISSLDYATVNEVWMFDRTIEQTWSKSMTKVPARRVELPPRLDAGVAAVDLPEMSIRVEPSAVGEDGMASSVRLTASIPDAEFDITATRPDDHDCLAVVVPWSRTRFQYTVKDIALPASGTITIEGVTHQLTPGTSWAVLDHGRGRWPYKVRWNWGAGSGRRDGMRVGLQVGGQWTDGTGQTENGIIVNGVLHKIHDELRWEFDRSDYLRPWQVTGGGLEAVFTPFYDKVSTKNLWFLSSSTHQCFGHWTGSLTTDDGDRFGFDGLVGFAEDVRNRW